MLFLIVCRSALTYAFSPTNQTSHITHFTDVRTELANSLACNITNAISSEKSIDHLHEGVKIGLESSIEKHSAGKFKSNI